MPSELVRLTWADVNWEQNRIVVHASKTEHHADGGIRVIPLFRELRDPLLALFAAAEDGAVNEFPGDWTEATNLRKRLNALAKLAGLAPWPKPWQNLRSTRETELFERYPAHVAASWIGNTVHVAI